jgi:hypothetical protein
MTLGRTDATGLEVDAVVVGVAPIPVRVEDSLHSTGGIAATAIAVVELAVKLARAAPLAVHLLAISAHALVLGGGAGALLGGVPGRGAFLSRGPHGRGGLAFLRRGLHRRRGPALLGGSVHGRGGPALLGGGLALLGRSPHWRRGLAFLSRGLPGSRLALLSRSPLGRRGLAFLRRGPALLGCGPLRRCGLALLGRGPALLGGSTQGRGGPALIGGGLALLGRRVPGRSGPTLLSRGLALLGRGAVLAVLGRGGGMVGAVLPGASSRLRGMGTLLTGRAVLLRGRRRSTSWHDAAGGALLLEWAGLAGSRVDSVVVRVAPVRNQSLMSKRSWKGK